MNGTLVYTSRIFKLLYLYRVSAGVLPQYLSPKELSTDLVSLLVLCRCSSIYEFGYCWFGVGGVFLRVSMMSRVVGWVPSWLWVASGSFTWVLGGALASFSIWCSGSNFIMSLGELGGEGERDR